MIARIRHYLALICPPYRRWVLFRHQGPAPFRGPCGPHY